VRILQLHTRYRQAGGEDAVVDADQRVLQEAGHEVVQYLGENPTGTLSAIGAFAGATWNPLAARRLGAVVDDLRPDVAHVHNTWFAFSPSVVAALRDRGVPVVMTVHNYRLACVNALLYRDGRPCEDCLGRGSLAAVRHRCYRGSGWASAVAASTVAVHRRLDTWSRSVDRFIVLSAFAASRLSRAGVPVDKMVDGSNFVADPGPRDSPPSGSADVLFVGRLSREKGLDILLRAWESRSAESRLRLVVVGDGPERAALEASAPDGVTFLGKRSRAEVDAMMRSARAVVIPSVWYEGQPVTALEGLAAGLPLVLSRIGGLPEIIGESGAGWTAGPGSVEALVDALRELQDDAAVDRRGAAARGRYLQKFTPAVALARLQHTYELAAEGRTA
jgi:glycosyltransferase involved in cell wall biosynthesis